MKKYMDKLKKNIRFNKKGITFLLGLSIIGFISGVIFITLISKSDQLLVKDYIESYIKEIGNKINYLDLFKNCFFDNLIFIIIVWLLGMSVIGAFINIFYYFIKAFTLGFSISSFILTYKLKGIIYSIIYIIPHNIINILVFTLLVYYSINFSFTLIYAILKKKNINFKIIFNKYLYILLIIFLIILLTSLYESFVVPNIISKLLFIIK